MAKQKKNCRPSFRISQAGHLLVTKGTSKAGRVLSSEGKAEKRKRKRRGCVHGLNGTVELSKLPKNLQKIILNYQKKIGRKIIN